MKCLPVWTRQPDTFDGVTAWPLAPFHNELSFLKARGAIDNSPLLSCGRLVMQQTRRCTIWLHSSRTHAGRPACQYRLEDFLLSRICIACDRRWDQMWARVDEFDRKYSREWELWDELPEELNAAYEEACLLQEADPHAAIAKLNELAAADHPFALARLGWCTWSGVGVEQDRDQAGEFFQRAIGSGSQLSIVDYSRFCVSIGRYEPALTALRSGVDQGHLPSQFWLAYFRWKSRKRRHISREIRPILEGLLDYDHAGARWFLAMFHLRGHYGLRGLRRGWNHMLRSIEQLNEDVPDEVVA